MPPSCRRHLNIRGKSANLPAITDRDWADIKFGIEVRSLAVNCSSLCLVCWASTAHQYHKAHMEWQRHALAPFPIATALPTALPTCLQIGVDYYALSFVRDAEVIYELKSYLAQEGGSSEVSCSFVG